MGRLGFSQVDVDEMELWVIATHLTGDDPSAADGAPIIGGTGGLDLADAEEAMTPEEWQRRSHALIRQRLDAATSQQEAVAVPTIPDGDLPD